MNTANGNVLTMYETVTHVAFGCGCVRTFHVDHPADTGDRCKEHGDTMVSTTQELVKRQSAA